MPSLNDRDFRGAGPSIAAPAAEPVFAALAPLELELVFDAAALCRDPRREACEDAAATLVYRSAGGESVPIEVTLRVRGRWRKETADCRLPALFVFFTEPHAAETPFAGEKMLPLTTHCREGRGYEQYVLKEYLAYRILNRLTDKSLRVRLARITYRDAGDQGRAVTRYAFFTEHFDALAARHAAEVWRPKELDVRSVDANELATVALFEYLIGNTDWSAVYSHNVVALRSASGAVSAVPYDFDFSGLVDAEYAGPPPGVPIASVRERIYRGFCAPEPNWPAVFASFEEPPRRHRSARRRDPARAATARRARSATSARSTASSSRRSAARPRSSTRAGRRRAFRPTAPRPCTRRSPR